MKAEVGMKYFLVISNLETGNVESSGLWEEVSLMNKSASEKVGPGLEREGSKGISGMYYDVKVGERNQTDLPDWQTEGEPGTFGSKSSGTNDNLLF